MRSPQEIAFRLRQEAANLWMAWHKPSLSSAPPPAPLAGLPDPNAVADALRGTPFATEVLSLADETCRHRFTLFDSKFDLGDEIDWHRDYQHGISPPCHYFRRIQYLDFSLSGDHKYIWELSRHQHLILLAQAWLFSRDPRYLDAISKLWGSWIRQNPFQYGINWCSALEVAFRALSWTWTWHLAGSDLPNTLRRQIWTELYRHGLYLEYNLSIYFSPNTHLLGEAVALHALGALFPTMSRAAKWLRLGREVTLSQLDFQIAADGSHFEQSTYYHVYATDFITFHHILEPLPSDGQATLLKMARFLSSLLGQERSLAFLGDDDGGRLFHPFGPRESFGRATLATVALLFPEGRLFFQSEDLAEQAQWWLGPQVCSKVVPPPKPASPSQRFPQSGITVLSHGDIQILADTGNFGYGGAGHSHSDALSLVIRRGREEILIDPATFTYIADAAQRDWFRSSAAHNTIRVDSADQATAAGPFRWRDPLTVELLAWKSTSKVDYLDARCGIHRRRLYFDKPGEWLLILDTLEGSGVHCVEQFWHLADDGARRRMSFAPVQPLSAASWRSRVLGSRQPAPVLCVRMDSTPLPLHMITAIDLSAAPSSLHLTMEASSADVWVQRGDQRVHFPPYGIEL